MSSSPKLFVSLLPPIASVRDRRLAWAIDNSLSHRLLSGKSSHLGQYDMIYDIGGGVCSRAEEANDDFDPVICLLNIPSMHIDKAMLSYVTQ